MIEEPGLRADAQRNRERILVAAEEVFLERGAGASLEDVARRAKVGIATLYRRFPTREALLAATSDDRLLALAETSRARDGTVEPGTALRVFARELVIHANHYQGLATSLGAVLQSHTPGCLASTAEGARLLEHAQHEGAVRKEVSLDDLVCMITAISLAVEQKGETRARIAHLVDLFFDGMSTG